MTLVDITPDLMRRLVLTRAHLTLLGANENITDPVDELVQAVVLARLDEGDLHSVKADRRLSVADVQRRGLLTAEKNRHTEANP